MHASERFRAPPRRVRLIDERRSLTVPGNTRCVSKPVDLDPITGKVDLVEEERGRRPVFAYLALDGDRKTVQPLPMPVSERYGGDSILVELDAPEQAGKRWVLAQVMP